MERIVTHLASRQHGVVARRQLVEQATSSDVVAGLVRRGRLLAVAHGVYVVPGTPRTPMREAMAAALRAGDGARVVGERMLAATGVRDAAPGGAFHVLLPPGRRLQNVDFPWSVDQHLGLGVPAVIDGVPSYGVPRNLVEAAVPGATDDDVRRLADGVRWTSRHRLVAVEQLATAAPDHLGARRLLMLGCLDVDAPESCPERVLGTILHPYRPERQVWVLPDVRLDFLIRPWSVGFEYDGPDHESGHARLADEARDQRVRSTCGIEVVRVTRRDLRDPASILARAAALARVA